MSRSVCIAAGALALLLVLVKGAFVVSLADVFFYGEELEKAVAAKAMIDGVAVPHYQLAYHYYEGGGFVISHLIALAFLVVGQNLLALKLVAIGCQVAILWMGCWFTRRLFGSPAALCFGLLFVFGPLSYQKLGLLALGIHFEACFFILATLLLGRRILFEPKASVGSWFSLGLVTGFGLYFSYMVAVPALWVAGLVLLRRRDELMGIRGVCALLGTAMGILPLLAMYRLVGSEIFNIHGDDLLGNVGGIGNLTLARDTLDSIFLGESGEVQWSVWIRLVSFLGALSFLFWRRPVLPATKTTSRRIESTYVLGFITLLLGVLFFSGFVPGRVQSDFGMSRLVGIWLFGTVLVAAAIGGLWESRQSSQRGLAVLVGGLLICLGVSSSLKVLGAGELSGIATNWSTLTRSKGYSYLQYFEKVLPHFNGGPAAKLKLVEKFEDPDPGLVRSAAVSALFGHKDREGEGYNRGKELRRVLVILRRAAGPDEQRLRDYELGIGALLVGARQWNRLGALAWAISQPEDVRAARLGALGRFGWKRDPMEDVLRKALRRSGGVPRSEAYYRGLGRWAYMQHRLRPVGFDEELQGLPQEAQFLLREGFELEQGWNMLDAAPGRMGLAGREVFAAESRSAK